MKGLLANPCINNYTHLTVLLFFIHGEIWYCFYASSHFYCRGSLHYQTLIISLQQMICTPLSAILKQLSNFRLLDFIVQEIKISYNKEDKHTNV